MPAILRTGDWLGSAVQSSLTFAQTKPTGCTNKANGKTIVKTVFEHEQHNAWPNESDLSAIARSILAKRTQGGASSGRWNQRSWVRRFMASSQSLPRSWSNTRLVSSGIVNQKRWSSSPSSWPAPQPAYPKAMRIFAGP